MMKTYEQTLEYIYSQLPMYQRIGKAAYKADLKTTEELDVHFGHPHRRFKSIHVAGTNGKGSVSHSIASVLQEAGYKTGLYTSPHLVDFRERIKINGEIIPKETVVDFVDTNQALFEKLKPSFFEMSVAMAFDYFAKENVDIAVIEVGMGGRLDSTNIITPELSIITNIGFDHTEFLGDTLEKIAAEKAGIIKPGVPVVIGETHPETKDVFIEKAKQQNAPVYFADFNFQCSFSTQTVEGKQRFFLKNRCCSVLDGLESDLNGLYQQKNIVTIVQALELLGKAGLNLSKEHIFSGISNVVKNTGLQGRWQVVSQKPLSICDTGHNEDGIRQVVSQIRNTPHKTLHFIFGVVNDKKIEMILQLLPHDAVYYFTKASIPRALDENILRMQAIEAGLSGECYPDVKSAYKTALQNADNSDLIFIGGSTFVVADFLIGIQNKKLLLE